MGDEVKWTERRKSARWESELQTESSRNVGRWEKKKKKSPRKYLQLN